MIEIIFTLCLVADTSRCVEKHKTFDAVKFYTPYSCASAAMLEAVHLEKELPAYRVSKWRCARAGLASKA